MNKRKLKLENYGISSNRYSELKAFCLQYPEWKDELLVKENPLKGMQYSDMPKGSSQKSQTEEIAIRCADLNTNCNLIEVTAKKASDDLWEYIIKNVCYNRGIAYLETIMEMPCERSAFYDARRYFFFLLSKERK